MRRRNIEDLARAFYRSWIRSVVSDELVLQRIKMMWFVWKYSKILRFHNFTSFERLQIILRFIRADFCILHSHRPDEIVRVCGVLSERPARPGEIAVEAGTWRGGSAAKISIICKKLGYELWIFDSFKGVERVNESSNGFAGQYAASQDELMQNLADYGEKSACLVFNGWFSETLARTPLSQPVRLAYIDCDLAKGTREVLQGVLPGLVSDGWLFSY